MHTASQDDWQSSRNCLNRKCAGFSHRPILLRSHASTFCESDAKDALAGSAWNGTVFAGPRIARPACGRRAIEQQVPEVASETIKEKARRNWRSAKARLQRWRVCRALITFSFDIAAGGSTAGLVRHC